MSRKYSTSMLKGGCVPRYKLELSDPWDPPYELQINKLMSSKWWIGTSNSQHISSMFSCFYYRVFETVIH